MYVDSALRMELALRLLTRTVPRVGVCVRTPSALWMAGAAFSEGPFDGVYGPGDPRGWRLSLGGAAAGPASGWGSQEPLRGLAQDLAAPRGVQEGTFRCLLWGAHRWWGEHVCGGFRSALLRRGTRTSQICVCVHACVVCVRVVCAFACVWACEACVSFTTRELLTLGRCANRSSDSPLVEMTARYYFYKFFYGGESQT